MSTVINIPAAQNEPYLMSIKTVCQALHCSRTTLYFLTKDGKIPVVKIGRITGYIPEDIRAFIEGQRKVQIGEGAAK